MQVQDSNQAFLFKDHSDHEIIGKRLVKFLQERCELAEQKKKVPFFYQAGLDFDHKSGK